MAAFTSSAENLWWTTMFSSQDRSSASPAGRRNSLVNWPRWNPLPSSAMTSSANE